MNSPGYPWTAGPMTAAEDKSRPRQALRMHGEEAGRIAAPSVLMPLAKTELTELLAGDAVVCVRRPAATGPAPQILAARQSSAIAAAPDDPDLARLIAVWPSLPLDIRAAIAAMICEPAAESHE